MSKKNKTNKITEEQKDFIEEAQKTLSKDSDNEKESKAPEDIADEEGFVDVDSKSKIPVDKALELKVSILEGDLIKEQLKAVHFEADALNRASQLTNLKMSDYKSKLTKKSRDHQELVEDISRKTGVKLKGGTVNYETGEVNFV